MGNVANLQQQSFPYAHTHIQVKERAELRDGPLGFRALQAACAGMSPSVLNQRLSELRAAALIESDQGSNQLSPLGQQLLAQFAPLNDWAEHWAGQLPLDEPSTPR